MLGVLLRYLCYAVAVASVAFGLMLMAKHLPGGLLLDHRVDDAARLGTSEFSPVEMLQNGILVLCVIIFAWIAVRDRLRRPMAAGFVALFLIGFIRELDFFLDRYVIDNLWQVCAALVLSVAVVFIYRHRKRFVQGWRRTWPSAGLAMVVGGLILLVPFAQIASNDEMWQAILGDAYVRTAKLAAEEFLELAAYLLIGIGSVEFLYTWSRLPDTRMMDARPRGRRRH